MFMQGYDTLLFIEIVLSEGVGDLGEREMDGENFRHLHGKNGKRVTICVSDEYTGIITLRQYLRELGLEELVPILFPTKEENDKNEASE